MRLVEKAGQFPAKCIFSSRTEGPFVDMGQDLIDATNIGGHIYIHEAVARNIGAAVGMLPKEERDELQEQLENQKQAIDALAEELESLRGIETALQTLNLIHNPSTEQEEALVGSDD